MSFSIRQTVPINGGARVSSELITREPRALLRPRKWPYRPYCRSTVPGTDPFLRPAGPAGCCRYLVYPADRGLAGPAQIRLLELPDHQRMESGDRIYGALAPIYGTLVTSAMALLIGVPVSFGIALFITELAPTLAQAPDWYRRGVAGGRPQHHLWHVGPVRVCALVCR